MTVHCGPGWRLRPYQPGDELHLVELFEVCFGRPMSLAEWRWKLKGLPSPVENVAVAASAEDRPIFQIGGLPRRLRTPAGDRLAMVAVDAMTAPAYRRQGVLTAACRETFEAWRAEGVSLVLGLPNEQWGSRTEALGWRPLMTLSWLIRPLQPQRIAAERLGIPALAGLSGVAALWNAPWRATNTAELRARHVDDPGEASARVLRAWSLQSSRAPYALLRDERWIRWRYFDAPHRRYHAIVVERGTDVRGYAIYCVVPGTRSRIAYLAEVGGPADDRLLGAVIRVATDSIRRDSSVDAVATAAVRGTPLHRALRRSGYVFGKPGFEVHGVFLDPKLPVAAIRQPESLRLVLGDFDGV